MNCHHSPQTERVSELLDVLSTDGCRDTLAYFRDASEDTARVDDIAAALSETDARDAEQFALRLHHVILPRLADAGVLEYDARTNTARYHGQDNLDSLFDAVENVTVPGNGPA